jgi:alcohol sulfotransferase
MVRDPRDVIVSSYFHATRQKHRFQGDMDRFIADQQGGLPALVRYLNGWAKGIEGRRAYVLSYEKLTAATVQETANVLSFLGCEIKYGDLERAVEAGRFSAMKDQELSIGLPAHEYDRSDVESLRMRRGQVGGFTDYLDARQVRAIEATCSSDLSAAAKQLLAGTGMQLAGSDAQSHPRALVDKLPQRAGESDRPGHDGHAASFSATIRPKLLLRSGRER